MTRFTFAAAAMLLALAPALALDGEPAMHDPSTVIEANGRFYVYATGNACPPSRQTTGGRGTGAARSCGPCRAANPGPT